MNEVAMMCSEILKWTPDVVITEKVGLLLSIFKGVSDLA
jgi:hypothetical protein